MFDVEVVWEVGDYVGSFVLYDGDFCVVVFELVLEFVWCVEWVVFYYDGFEV